MVDSPYIIAGGIEKDPNGIIDMNHRFQQAKATDYQDRLRGIRNMNAYLNDALPQYLKSALQAENRQEQNFNLLLFIIRGHVGNVLMNWFDPKFVGRQNESAEALDALSDIYLSQKELYNYKASAASCYENGYVYRGVEQLIIDKPNSNPRNWGIKFVNHRPDMVVLDQMVYDDKISRHAKEAWIIHYFTPSRIIRTWGMPNTSTERDILLRLQRDEFKAAAFDKPTRKLYDTVESARYGHSYQVVEWQHIEYEKKVRRFLKNGIEMPDSGYEIGTLEDISFVQQWAQARGIELSDDMVLTFKDDVPCMYNTPFIPDLNILIDNRKDFRQLDGCLPLYAWSFTQKNGVSLGLVDYEWDVQQDFTKRELAKTKLITKTPIAGKPWIRRDMFENKDDFDDAVDNYTDSSVPLIIPESAPPVPEGFGFIQGTQFPPSILQDETFKLMLAERIGMLPPALQGRSERTSDTGVAIGRKVVEANTMIKQESESIIQHENDKHEDWLKMAIKLFGSSVNMNRMFQSMGGKKKTVINEPIGTDENGKMIVRNDIGSLTRVGVIITQAKENDFVSQIRMEKAVAGLQAMIPSDTNTLNRAAMEYTIVTSNDYATDEDRERSKRIADLQLEIVETKGKLDLKVLKSQLNKSVSSNGMDNSGAMAMPENNFSPEGVAMTSSDVPEAVNA